MPNSIADTPVAFEKPVQPGRAQPEFSFGDVPALCTALRAGDETAFGWLYKAWGARINRYCFVLARGDDTLCAEIGQAAWIRLSRSIRELPNQTALWNWIARAARHSAIDLQRGKARYYLSLTRFWEWFVMPGPDESGAQDADELLMRALDHALANLTEDERNLIEKKYFEGSSLEQMGTDSGLSVRAVEGRLARLRVRLRAALKDELEKSPNEKRI